MAASLLSDYLTFIRVSGWAAATVVCWLAAGLPRMPPRRAGLALGMFCAAQMTFGVGGFFHYDVLSFGMATGAWLALAKLASFAGLREFGRGLCAERAGGRMASPLLHLPLMVALVLAAAGRWWPAPLATVARVGELGLLILALLIGADASGQLVRWAEVREGSAGGRPRVPRWVGAISMAVYVDAGVALAVRMEMPAALDALLSIAPWLLAAGLMAASLRTSGARWRLTAGLALTAAVAALATPLVAHAGGLAKADSILLAGGLAVVFCQVGWVFAWWQSLVAAQQLAAARREAASRAKTEFIAFLGHELRTPLQTILGRAELLYGENEPAVRRSAATTIVAEGRAMLRLVNDLLDLGAIEAGRFELRPQACALHALVAEITTVPAANARAKGLEFALSIAPDVPEGAFVDAARLQQILGNLLGNAVKYTEAGGVALHVAPTAPQADDPAGSARLKFVVSDTGRGLPQAEIARLFTLFTRLDPAAGEGAGIGLALVKRLVGRMGGVVTAANQCDRPGAEFTVELCLPVTKRPRPAPEPARAGPGSPRRVLVVDDHAPGRELLADFVRRLGHVPTAVADARATRAALVAGAFDAVLLDVNLPDADGVALAAEIAARRDRAGRPRIIGCSAGITPAARAGALAAGMDKFLAKPVTLAELAAALTETPDAGETVFAFVAMTDAGRAARAQALADLPAARAAVCDAVAARDVDTARRRAHHLHNSALVLGDVIVARLAEDVVRAAAGNDVTALTEAGGRLASHRLAPV